MMDLPQILLTAFCVPPCYGAIGVTPILLGFSLDRWWSRVMSGDANAQRRHRIDPVKDCASQQLQRPISDKSHHTTAAITSTMITIKIGVSSMVRSPRANLIEMDI